MTPGAHIAAAIEIFDEILAGSAAEAVLTRWARSNRFAGSKDRLAIRDLVFSGLRRKRSAAAWGGGLTGRGVMLGLARQDGADIPALFSGLGYAPPTLTADEMALLSTDPALSVAEAADLPDEIWPIWSNDLGDKAMSIAQVSRSRAPISLRVNVAKIARQDAIKALWNAQIEAVENPRSQTALTLLNGERKLKTSDAFLDGLVEPQDASSQAVLDQLPDVSGLRVLDYCAGGGGKALALAARGAKVVAHDINSNRMNDIAGRADRAGTPVQVVAPGSISAASNFDLVLCDVPCSGSGTWRRAPDAKWQFTPADLEQVSKLQREICQSALEHVIDGGVFAYVTCSVFVSENGANADWLANLPNLHEITRLQLVPDAFGDGLFIALFKCE